MSSYRMSDFAAMLGFPDRYASDPDLEQRRREIDRRRLFPRGENEEPPDDGMVRLAQLSPDEQAALDQRLKEHRRKLKRREYDRQRRAKARYARRVAMVERITERDRNREVK
jgi:hypothetical protein